MLGLLLVPPVARGDERSGGEFFESAIRPLLVAKCQPCHGGDDRTESGLDLTTREGLLAGGESGPAAVPGRPGESLLMEAIGYEFEPRMPPKGRLPDPEIAALRRWIELGLPWPGSPETEADRPVAAPTAARRPLGLPAGPRRRRAPAGGR